MAINFGKSAQSQPDVWQKLEQQGWDMSLIEANLQLSYHQRCLQHDRAATQAAQLRSAAMKQIDGLSDAIEATSRA